MCYKPPPQTYSTETLHGRLSLKLGNVRLLLLPASPSALVWLYWTQWKIRKKHDSHTASSTLQVWKWSVQEADDCIIHPKIRMVSKLQGAQQRAHQRSEVGENDPLPVFIEAGVINAFMLLHQILTLPSEYSSRSCDSWGQATFSSLLLSDFGEPIWTVVSVSCS